MAENMWHFVVISFLYNRIIGTIVSIIIISRLIFRWTISHAAFADSLAFIRIEDLVGRCPFANIVGWIT